MDTVGLVLVRSVILAVALASLFAGMTVIERKVLGYFHLRLGPTRTGPWGLLQPLADAIKAIVKEDIIPRDADRLVFRLAPIISVFTALAAWSVIPVGPPVEVGGVTVPLAVADPPGGVLVAVAFTALSVYGVTLAGWSSQSKYALLGSLRASAQLISYELALGLSLLGVLMMAGSLRLTEIVAAQERLPFILLQPLGFVVYFIAALAESARVPFDLPEAETELVSGYHTEYSGMRFAMFMMAEYIHMITASTLVTLLYLGGWNGPAFLPPVAWFLVKLGFMLFVFIWLRATMVRLRYDRLMDLGWKVLLPLAILNLVATAVITVFVA
ncbi:MAG: NADH-quinone oxidoreductase subunit NuoH [Bacillota bacterium]|nr:NADH-quinone oxidoreductase subunit NuoH [Bacillota bacterium]REJ37393.1 MAG: NADH-quinone oxidoreductase subunit NuoH [Bacillota bacterium]